MESRSTEDLRASFLWESTAWYNRFRETKDCRVGVRSCQDRPLAPADFADPVIEVCKNDVDRTLLRENLKLTVQQRFEKLMAFMEFAAEMRKAGSSRRRGLENES